MCDRAAAEQATGSAAAAAAAGAAAAVAAEPLQQLPASHGAAIVAGFSSPTAGAKWQARASTNCSRWTTGSSLGSVDSHAAGLRHAAAAAAADVCYRNTYQFPENNVAVLRLARPTLLPKHDLARRARFANFGGGLPKRRGAAAAEDDGDEVCLYQITQWSIKHFQDRLAAIEMARGGLLPRLTPRSVTIAPTLAGPALAAR